MGEGEKRKKKSKKEDEEEEAEEDGRSLLLPSFLHSCFFLRVVCSTGLKFHGRRA